MPRDVPRRLAAELERWAERGVDGHFPDGAPRRKRAGAGAFAGPEAGWLDYHERFSAPLAKLVGAKPDEVVAMNTLTVNLHLMLVSFFRPTKRRFKILIERDAFPSDRYAVQSQLRFHGLDPRDALLELGSRRGSFELDRERLDALLEREGDRIALILLPGVQYLSGERLDVGELTRAARRHGCAIGFDLAHAIGNVPLALHSDAPDFAVWCSYKYLNGGPGCVAGCFVHARHAHDRDIPRFTGWWGHDEKVRFKMDPDFHAMEGAEGWQLSNPPIMALAPLRASMEIFQEATIDRLRAKSIKLTAYLEFLLKETRGHRFSIITPSEEARRGCQLSFRIPDRGRNVCDKLAAEGVIGDWREPDIYRVAAVPLYNSYQDVYCFVQRFLAALV